MIIEIEILKILLGSLYFSHFLNRHSPYVLYELFNPDDRTEIVSN